MAVYELNSGRGRPGPGARNGDAAALDALRADLAALVAMGLVEERSGGGRRRYGLTTLGRAVARGPAAPRR
jgi:hypothetical protein